MNRHKDNDTFRICFVSSDFFFVCKLLSVGERERNEYNLINKSSSLGIFTFIN